MHADPHSLRALRPGSDASRITVDRAHQRPARHAADTEERCAAAVGNRGDCDHGEVAVAARHFAKRDALPLRYRKTHCHDQFVGLTRRGHYVLLKGFRGQHPLTALRTQHYRAAEHRERQRQFRTRIGVRDRAAHRAPVAGLKNDRQTAAPPRAAAASA